MAVLDARLTLLETVGGTVGLSSAFPNGEGGRVTLRSDVRRGLSTVAADLTFRNGFFVFVGGLAAFAGLAKKLVVYGDGLCAPSLALIGIFRELDRVGTGNGGATVEASPFIASGTLELLGRGWLSTPPTDAMACRLFASFGGN